jgi:fumarate reductase flavoprotein subunit
MRHPSAKSNDIIVIGAGGCGLMASLVAARSGARVLLLEKTAEPGGGTAFSTKGIRAAGTRFQRALGIEDSAEQYAQDILRRNGNQSDEALTRRLTQTCGPVTELLADVAGIRFAVGEFPFGHSARRSHSWNVAKTITDFLFEAVQREPGIEVHFSTAVGSIDRDESGVVSGVVTEKGALPAAKVIIASGGFGASPELLAEYIPDAVGIPFPGHFGSTGDGIRMGMALGAAVEHMGAFQPYPAYVGPEKRSVPPEVALSGGIMVDVDGRRFVDETRYPGGLSAGMLALPDKRAFEILDERVYQLQRHELAGFRKEGLLKQGQSPGELAAQLTIDSDGLEQTIRACNQLAGGGADSFGRRLPAPMGGAFYGIEVKVALYHTQGGLKVNVDGQVLRADDTVIAGLYAGGGAAIGVSGSGMEGYLPGNGQLASLGLGMIAGEHAAASLSSLAGPPLAPSA